MKAEIGFDLGTTSQADLRERFTRVRQRTNELAAPLSAEDQMVQSMPDVSPTKWHLAHTTWFFEEFVLAVYKQGYRRFNADYGYLFNSYYNGVGEMHPRPRRGLLSRPGLAEIHAYRDHVNEQMLELLSHAGGNRRLEALVMLGTHHEQQHQELMLTDIKHVLWCNPLQPAYAGAVPAAPRRAPALTFADGEHGIVEIGSGGNGFCFDNERPRHRHWLEPHALANRPVTNAEFRAFIEDGGYSRPELWLSDGWSTLQRTQWKRPLYWSADLATVFSLTGPRPLDPEAPVCHVSFYEADAYARWAEARLPTEAEWERMAGGLEMQGNFQENGHLRPVSDDGDGVIQLFGDVWEWTASAYLSYPGYRPPAGAIGEYNGKFMCNQMVLRGGSCATPRDHVRASYRNFFYPEARWQFTGIRLARDTS